VPNLHTLSGIEVIRALERLGFRQVRQRGSHVVLRKDSLERAAGCSVPLHKELKIGTIKSILRQAKVDQEEFLLIV